jgi:hypothetical protein
VTKDGTKDRSSFAEASVAAVLATSEARATDAALESMKLLRDVAASKADVAVSFKQGNFFEVIEWSKLAVDAARKNVPLTGGVTALNGAPTAAADVIAATRGGPDLFFQLKSYGNLRSAALALIQPKYDGMYLVVPSDQIDGLRETISSLAEAKPLLADELNDAAKRLRSSLRVGDAVSEGTTRAELKAAAENPERHATRFELNTFAGELATATVGGAVAGAIVRGAWRTACSYLEVRRGTMTASDAVRQTSSDAVRGAIRGGAAGGAGTIVRFGASKLGMETLAKSNVAAAVANCAIDVGVAVYDFVQGRTTVEETIERVGVSTASTASGVYSGAAAGLVFGPVGVVVGGIAGYMASTQILQSCLSIIRDARLMEAEALRAQALAAAASAELERQKEIVRAQLEIVADADAVIAAALTSVDASLRDGDVDALTLALADGVSVFGQALQFTSFEAFDEFMQRDEPLHF